MRKKSKDEFKAGFVSEYLGSSAGSIGKTGVGIINLRMHPTDSYDSTTIMLTRPAIERLIEDLNHLMANSPSLVHAEHNEISLDDMQKLVLV
jgi:hypothetical protein